MENNNQQSFWQFSDQLRVHTSNLANLSLNDSIWGNNYSSSKNQRRNFDTKLGGGEIIINNNINSVSLGKSPVSDHFNNEGSSFFSFDVGVSPLNGGFNKGIYSKPSYGGNFNSNMNVTKGEDEIFYPSKPSKKNSNPNKKQGENNNNSDGNKNKDSKAAADKRFKTLPPAESLPRNETIGGYIFVCNNDTMAENLKRQLFGKDPFFPKLFPLIMQFLLLFPIFFPSIMQLFLVDAIVVLNTILLLLFDKKKLKVKRIQIIIIISFKKNKNIIIIIIIIVISN